jgi:MoxR-like ATPase
VFEPGPLVRALEEGCLLYVEEINRIPEETLNVLITVMSEGELHIPRLGRVPAADGFRLVAAMNPFDAVGTARISSAVYDRTCRLAMDYQAAPEEQDVVVRAVGEAAADEVWVGKVVELVRRTRTHPDLRIGSSVRGAIDLALVAASLGSLRGRPGTDPSVCLDAALVALSGRVRVREGSTRTSEDIVRELWEDVFGRRMGGDQREGKADAPTRA